MCPGVHPDFPWPTLSLCRSINLRLWSCSLRLLLSIGRYTNRDGTRWGVRDMSLLQVVEQGGAGMPILTIQVSSSLIEFISGYKREERPYRSVQYQRPGVQVQVTSGQARTYQEQGIYSYPNPYYSSSLCSYFPYTPYYCSPLTFFVYAQPTESRVYVQAQNPPAPPVPVPVQPGKSSYPP